MSHWCHHRHNDDCDCYDQGYSDGEAQAIQELETSLETPLSQAVAGLGTSGRVTSYRVRDWAEAQRDRHFRYWLLGIADAFEAIEDNRRQAAEKAAANERRIAAELLAKAQAARGWPG